MFKLKRHLPLLVVLGAWGFYGLTLNHGVAMNSLALTATVAGWDPMPQVGQPLLWLLTLPLRLLPAGWVAVGLNLLAATAAALTLGLLARSVSLLPWDQPWAAGNRRAAALPVGLAVVLCGLEFSFWSAATTTPGEMLDVLLLATSLWLLLEYRVRREARWLDAAAWVWGLGMAENWAMLLALPLFVVGVIWLRGRRFFRMGFILRLAGLGLAGLSIYALLPLVNGLAAHAEGSQAWRANWQQTETILRVLYYQFWVGHRLLTVVVALYFLVPTLSFLVRLRDEGTKHKARMDRFQTRLYRGLRGLLLLACLWLALDPVTGPRQLVQSQCGATLPLLTFDYLNALGAAFLAGNFLLLAQSPGLRKRRAGRAWRKLAAPCTSGLVLLMGAGLAARNTPALLHLNGHPLDPLGELAVASLPAGGGVMLSDQPQPLAVFQAALAHHHAAPDWLAVDTRTLPTVAGREALERRQPAGWLTAENHHALAPAEMLRLLEHIARTHRLFYLHPSYGYFFERFYQVPTGAIYELKPRGTNPWAIPRLSRADTETNEVFWNHAWATELAALTPLPRPPLTFWQRQFNKTGVTAAPRDQDPLLAEWYSLVLDGWGVALQRLGRWPEAQVRLEQALQLNSNNFSARISLAANTNLQAGVQLNLAAVSKVAEQLGSLQRLSQVMNSGGPFDDPLFCYLLGCTYQKTGLMWQAVEQFERTRALAPGVLAPEFALADLYTRLQLTDRAQPLIRQLRDQTRKSPESSAMDVELGLLEANSWLAQTNVPNARDALQSVLQRHPDDAPTASRVMRAYLSFGDTTNALRIVTSQLAQAPDDVPGLQNQAAILIQSGQAAAATVVLDHLLALTNLPTARLMRATARLVLVDLAAAEADYRVLEKTGEEPARVSYGLALLAERRHDTNQAQHYLRLCLTHFPPGSKPWQQVNLRLQSLAP